LPREPAKRSFQFNNLADYTLIVDVSSEKHRKRHAVSGDKKERPKKRQKTTEERKAGKKTPVIPKARRRSGRISARRRPALTKPEPERTEKHSNHASGSSSSLASTPAHKMIVPKITMASVQKSLPKLGRVSSQSYLERDPAVAFATAPVAAMGPAPTSTKALLPSPYGPYQHVPVSSAQKWNEIRRGGQQGKKNKGGEITVLDEKDVLLGRGNGIATHPGNCLYREMVWNAREDYKKAFRFEKMYVVDHVYRQIITYGGRFLERLERSDKYLVVSEVRVKEKISQALREKKWTRPVTSKWTWTEYFNLAPKKQTNTKKRKAPAKKKAPPKKKQQQHSKPKLPVQGTQKKETTTAISVQTGARATIPVQVAPVASSLNTTLIDRVDNGWRLSIFWPLENKYLSATVLEKDSSRKSARFFVEWEDKEKEWIDLTERSFKVEAVPK
jgi:hypothetical protein